VTSVETSTATSHVTTLDVTCDDTWTNNWDVQQATYQEHTVKIFGDFFGSKKALFF